MGAQRKQSDGTLVRCAGDGEKHAVRGRLLYRRFRPPAIPDRVLAKLGGWKSPRTLDIHRQSSDDVMLEVLEQRRALREAQP